MPRFAKGSQEAKDYMRMIREKKKCITNIEYETASGEKKQKRFYTSNTKTTETLPNGDKIVKTTSKKMKDRPIKKTNDETINVDLDELRLGENIVVEPDIIPEPEPSAKKPRQKYATEEERKKAKREQTLASNKRKREERKQAKLQGSGVIKDITKGLKKAGRSAKRFIGTAGEVISTGASNIGKTLKEGFEAVADYGKAVAVGRGDEYPPKVRKIIDKYGDQIITGLTIMRTPVPDILTKALSLFSGGQFGKNLEASPYDTLFHLFLEMNTQSGVRISVEKNEVINMDVRPKKRDQTETKVVSNVPQGITIREMLEKTRERMGDRYFKYSARDNNCQDFIVAIFKANGFGDDSDIQFIKQDTKQLFEDLPYLRKIANTITDIGGRVNVIATGRGMDSEKDYVVQSVIFRTDKWTTPKAKKWLKENGYSVPKVDKKEEHLRFRQQEPSSVEEQGFTEYRTKELGDGSGISLILAYKKNKISKKSIMPRKMKGSGAIPTQQLVEQEFGKPEMTGGALCDACKQHMTGGKLKIKVPKALSKLGSDIKKGFEKEIIKPSEKALVPLANKAEDYITAKKGGLATDVIKFGIPAVSGALLGGVAGLAGGPVAGVAGSALGSKLGSLGAQEVQKATGTGMVRKGRFVKGSQEAKDYMKMLREKRMK